MCCADMRSVTSDAEDAAVHATARSRTMSYANAADRRTFREVTVRVVARTALDSPQPAPALERVP